MGQLIKLENYISRYERDIYHYPTQHIRLKQEQWKNLFDIWQERISVAAIEVESEENEQGSFFQRWKERLNRREQVEIEYAEESIPQTEIELKKSFLDSIYQFQLNWASTTLSEMSFLDRMYYDDLVLKYFLQRFPDTYLFMYKPMFKLKQTLVDAGLIMITPLGVNVIKLVEHSSDRLIIVGDDRSWFIEQNNVQEKLLSPMLSLNRTAKIIASILNFHELEFPIKKLVLSRTNQISYHLEPFQTEFIDRDNHEDWVQKQRQFSAPLKHIQLKVADALLSHADTFAVNRPEWNRSKNEEN